ncbi:hypothetical protein B0H34DRAFT_273530 [Crassisporium funariophilum]|nr:hypothetical protein B0H34DRAFT_273530 [Crassisporium funariophilum]
MIPIPTRNHSHALLLHRGCLPFFFCNHLTCGLSPYVDDFVAWFLVLALVLALALWHCSFIPIPDVLSGLLLFYFIDHCVADCPFFTYRTLAIQTFLRLPSPHPTLPYGACWFYSACFRIVLLTP